MRGVFLLLVFLAGSMATMVTSRAEETTTVVTFNGTASMMTPLFKVGDKWELRWSSSHIISISVVAADGTIVAGTSGLFRGSFYLPKGGDFHLQIEVAPPSASSPANGSPGTTGTSSSGWNIQVVEFGKNPLPNQGLVTSPNYIPPSPASSTNTLQATAPTPAPNPASTPPSALSEDEAHAVVLIRGDNAEGTGFMVKTADGPVVITNLHVISNNPNVRITTISGLEVTIQGLKGAADRDLAEFAIKDESFFHYLESATDISTTVQPGDAVITPGNSEDGEVMLNTEGKVLRIGPQQIEINNTVSHGNSGGPVLYKKSGKVLAVITEVPKVDVSNDLDKISFQSRNSAAGSSMRYFGLRMDNVPKWEVLDWRRFQNETLFLDQFHQESLCLDSFLNTSFNTSHRSHGGNNNTSTANLYLSNDKIRSACERYLQQSTDSDDGQQKDAVRGLLFELNGVADTNMSAIEDLDNFYSYDQQRAKNEIDYRQALKAELDSLGDDVDRINALAHRNVTN